MAQISTLLCLWQGFRKPCLKNSSAVFTMLTEYNHTDCVNLWFQPLLYWIEIRGPCCHWNKLKSQAIPTIEQGGDDECFVTWCIVPVEVGYSFQMGRLWLYRDTDGQQCSYTTTASKRSTVKGPKVCQVNSSGTITLSAAYMGWLKRIIITPWSFGNAQHCYKESQFEWHFPLATFFNKVFLAREPFAVSPVQHQRSCNSQSLWYHIYSSFSLVEKQLNILTCFIHHMLNVICNFGLFCLYKNSVLCCFIFVIMVFYLIIVIIIVLLHCYSSNYSRRMNRKSRTFKENRLLPRCKIRCNCSRVFVLNKWTWKAACLITSS